MTTLTTLRSAPPTRWDPFRELDEMHTRMGQLVQSAFGDLDLDGHGFTPAVDVEETEEAFVLEADLPGVDRKDVTVETAGNEVRIHGEVKDRERTGILRRRARRTGRFDYRVALPAEIDADQVTATLEAGVLRVTARKAESVRPRRVEITAA